MSWSPKFLLIAEIDLFLRNIWNLWCQYKEIIKELEKAREADPQEYRKVLRNATENEFLLLLNKLEVLPVPKEGKCKRIKSIFKQGIHNTIKDCAGLLMNDDDDFLTSWNWGADQRLVEVYDPNPSTEYPNYDIQFLLPVPERLFEAMRPSINSLRKKYKQEFKMLD